MAEKTVTTVKLVDDLTGEEIASGRKPIGFKLDGQDFSIDLTADNEKKLKAAIADLDKARAAVKKFADKGRPAGVSTPKSSSKRSGKKKGGSGRNDLAAVRAWAAANGHDVAPRGRIASSVFEAYDAR